MDPALEQALSMLDQAAAIIQELVAQQQSKQPEQNMNKKAELLAVETGLSFDAASDMIKQAEETGTSVDLLVKVAQASRRNNSFGKVASLEEKGFTKTGSVAMDKYLEREMEIQSELGL